MKEKEPRATFEESGAARERFLPAEKRKFYLNVTPKEKRRLS
jgi:hypothetical protein